MLAVLIPLLATPLWAQPLAPPPAAAPADPDAGKPVADVRIVGLHDVGEARAESHIRTKAGELYDPEMVRGDVRELLKIRQFQNVWAAKQVTADDKVVVTFNVVEYNRLVRVEFVGNRAIATAELEKTAPFPGSPKDPAAISRAAADIRDLYQEKGYYFASVEVDRTALDEGNVLIFLITEGPHVQIEAVRFAGNLSFSDDLLQRQIATSDKKLWFLPKLPGNHTYLQGEQVRQDVTKLLQFYLRQGFREARVSRRLEFSADRRRVTVEFLIEEGPRFTIGAWRFEGNQRFTDEELANAVAEWFSAGAHFTQHRLSKAVEAISDLYGSVGYVYARVEPQLIDPAKGTAVTVVFRIVEGEAFRIGKIVIEGNRITQGKVARREFDFYPEDLIDMSKIRQMQKDIRYTRLFSSAEVSLTPVAGKPGYRDITVQLEEEERTGSILFGVGLTSNSGFVGSIVIEERNFDWTDFPESLGEFFRLKAFKGAGQTLRLRLEPGTENSRFSIEYMDPALFDSDWRMGWNLFYTMYDRDEYSEDRFGFKISFAKALSWLKPWSGSIGLRAENIDISGLEPDSAPDILAVAGSSTLTSATLGLTLDRRDNAYVPSTGYRLALSYEQAGAMGGDYTFAKFIADAKTYRTLKTDMLDRKSVLSLKARVGYIAGDVPVFERFFGGGIGSIRGFAFRGIGERQGIHNDNVGGSWLLTAGAEYEFPLAGENLRGVVFLDTGTVQEDIGLDLRASVGFGIRVVVPALGPVPISLDLAWPIASRDLDDTQILQFTLGATF